MELTRALEELRLLIRSRYGLIVLDSHVEERVETLLADLSVACGLPMFTWSLPRGMRAVRTPEPVGRVAALQPAAPGTGSGAYGTNTPEGALDFAASSDRPALYVFEGLDAFLGEPAVAAKLLDVARRFARREGALVLLGPDLDLPVALAPHAAHLRLPEPDEREYRALLDRTFRDLSRTGTYAFEVTDTELTSLLTHLRGLSLLEAEKVLTRAILADGRLAVTDVERIVEAKRHVVEREGLLEYHPAGADDPDVVGMDRLRGWLSQRAELLRRPEEARRFGLDFPKGVLLLGVPGVGKSLAAKTVARSWGLPLLRLDTGALYDKYVGETERKFRQALRTAGRVAPCVLWVDEIEKAFADGGDTDGGASRRVLATFLTWMQDRSGDVFVVATANDVGRIPPELLRKGRFDELFFLDLPDIHAREELFRVHLRRRGHDPAELDVTALADASNLFSGAEVEAAIVAALYSAFGARSALTTEGLLAEVRATRPLAVTRAEEVAALRRWARERTVAAH